MCGRFAQTKAAVDLLNKYRFLMADHSVLNKRYNVVPMQTHPVFTATGAMPMRWGLLPHWAKVATIDAMLINARSETLHEKPSFRDTFKKRHCLVPATGFYEWKKEGGAKTPYYISLADATPFVFAGLWESWRDTDGTELFTFTIITTDANALVKPIHDRMPVIMDAAQAQSWIDPKYPPQDAQTLLQSYPSQAMSAYPVSPRVNSPSCDTPDCTLAVISQVQGDLF